MEKLIYLVEKLFSNFQFIRGESFVAIDLVRKHQICHCTIFSSWTTFLNEIKHFRRSKSDLSTAEIRFVSAHKIRFAPNIPLKMKYLWKLDCSGSVSRYEFLPLLRRGALIIEGNHFWPISFVSQMMSRSTFAPRAYRISWLSSTKLDFIFMILYLSVSWQIQKFQIWKHSGEICYRCINSFTLVVPKMEHFISSVFFCEYPSWICPIFGSF